MTASGWTTALDAFEARLAAQRAALDEHDPDVAPFIPPADLGPLPVELLSRAQDLLGRARALEHDLATRVAAAGAAVADAAPRAAAASPAFLDTRV